MPDVKFEAITQRFVDVFPVLLNLFGELLHVELA